MGDTIDESLARYINHYPERDQLKLIFLRESEGVYMFGHRRVAIKVDGKGQPVIRIGGGFMPVQDFLDTYANKEISKLIRPNKI